MFSKYFKSSLFFNTLVNYFLVVLTYIIAIKIDPSYSLWAPITALIVIQPTRGKSYHVGVQRFFGTIFGSLLSIALMMLFHDNIYLSGFVITLVVAISAGIASMNTIGSGAIFQLTGYTAAIVFFISFGNNHDVKEISALRIVESFIGISIALFGLRIFRRESESKKLSLALLDVKNSALEWVRLSIRDGVNDDNVKLRRDLLNKINALNELSTLAFSEKLYFGMTKRKSIYYIGTFYTILSVNRRILRKLSHDNPSNRSELSEVDFPELDELFKKLDAPITQIKIKNRRNMKAAKIAFIRVLIAGSTSGALWMATGVREAATFFMTTLVHSCLLTSVPRPNEQIKRFVTSVCLSFFAVFCYFLVLGPIYPLSVLSFALIVLPGFALQFSPRFNQYSSGASLFSLVMFSTISSHKGDFELSIIFREYAAFIGALLYSLLLARVFMPRLSKDYYNENQELLQKEFKKLANFNRPLENDWMMTMYSYIEKMIFYGKEIQLDEAVVMNEALSIVDVSVEILELRSRIALLPQEQKNEIMAAVANLKNFSVKIEHRTAELLKLQQSFESIDSQIAMTIGIIISKMTKNTKIFSA